MGIGLLIFILFFLKRSFQVQKRVAFFSRFLILCFLFGLLVTMSVFSEEKPPKGQIIAEVKFEKINDNQWSNVELKREQPVGIYYIEMTSESKLPWGAWG